MFFTTFRRFPTTFRRFPKIFQNCSEGLTKASEHFMNIFRRLPKVAEDFRGIADDVLIIQHHLWVLFKRLCSYSNGNLKTCETTFDIVTRENIVLFHTCWDFRIESIAWKTHTDLSSSNHNRETTFSHVGKAFHPIRNQLSKWIS